MPLYSIQGPDGRTYELEGPEGATREQVIAAIQAQMQGQSDELGSSLGSQLASTYKGIDRSSSEESTFIENILSGFGSGVVNTGEMAALGGAALLEEENELAAREKIQSAADYLRPEGGDQDALSYKISSGLGSVVGALGAAAGATYGAGALGAGAAVATGAGLLTAGGIGVGAGAGEASERARAAGATEEERNAATRRGAAIGSLEILPLGKILKVPGATKLMDKIGGKAVEEGGSRIRSALTTGGAEAAQEAAAAFLQNMNEQGYNPEKELLDAGIIDEAIAGGGAGVIVQGVVDFFVKGRAVKRSATDSTSDIEEVTLPETDPIEAETLAREAETSALEAQALEAADRGDEATFEQASAEAAQPDMFTRELQEAREARPEAALRGQLESQGAERVPQREGITEPVAAPAQPTPVQEDMIDRLDKMEIDDAEIAEIEAMLQADAVAEAELDAIRGESQLESLERRREGDRKKTSEEKRYSILQQTIEETPTRNYNTLSKNFEKRLKAAGIKKTKATKDETKTIRSAVNVQRAETPKAPETPEVTPPPEATQLEGMEARIPERTDKSVIPSQMSFPGMGRKKTPPVKETPPAPNTITKEFMDGLGIAPKAPIRKRTEGKDLNDPVVREQFVAFANNKKVPEQTRLNVARNLEGVPEAQLELFQPQSRKRTAPAKGGLDATTRTTQPTPSRDSVPISGSPVGTARPDTTAQPSAEVPQPPRGRGVASARSGVSDPVRGEGAQQLALDLPEPVAPPEKEKPKRKTKKKATAKKPVRRAVAKKELVSDASAGQPEKTTTPKQVITKDSAKKKTTSTTRKVMPVLETKKTTPALAPKGKAGKQLTERFEQQSEPVKQFAQQTSQEFNEIAGKERTTPDDQLKILTLLTNGAAARDKLGNAVITYLGKVPRPTDGLYMAIFDVANGTPQFRKTPDMGQSEVDFFQGMGNKPAQQVLDWAKTNLSAETNTWIDETLAKEIREMQRIESTDYVEMFRQREAKLAAKEMAEQAQTEADMRQDLRANLDELASMFEKKLARGSVMGLDVPLHPGVRGLLRAGNLKEALSTLAATTADKRISQMAKKLTKAVGETKIEVVKDLKDAGSFDPKTNTIKLDSEIGMNPHVLLHEMTHAAASDTLSNKNHPMTRQLTKLFEDVKPYLDTAYGAKDVDEFVSEAMSNPEFQAKLAKINPKGEEINALQRFFNSVGNFLRKLVGMQPKKIESAQTVADRLVDGILAPAPKFRNANELAMKSTAKGVKEEMKGIDDTQKELHKPLTNVFRGEWADGMADMFTAVGEKTAFILPKLMDSQALSDVAKRANAKLGKLAAEFHELMERQRGSMARADDFVRDQVKVVDKWIASGGTKEKQKNLNDLIYSQEYGATIYQVDPTKPRSTYKGKTDESGNSLEKVWDAQRKDWDALGTDGQKAYRTMRDMYRDLYGKLKDAINGRIDEALRDNPDAAAELKKEVFAKLFDGNTLDVYFPLLREGRYKLEFQYKDSAVKSENDKYVFQMFDSKRQRDRVLAELKKDPDVISNTVKGMDGDFSSADFNNAPSSSFVKQVLDSLSANKVDDTVQSEIMRLFIDALPESSFAKSLQRRKGTPGYMQDAVYAMKSKGFDLGRQVEKLKYNALIQSMEVRLNELEVPADDFRFNTISEEIKVRMNFAKYGAKMKGVERYVRMFNQLAFVGTIGFNVASAMVQTAQTPMFTYPMLGARYGYKKAYNEIMHATSFVTGARVNAEEIKEATGIRGKTVAATQKISVAHGLDSYYDITDNGDFVVKKDKDIPAERLKELERMAPLVRMASERGHLNRSFIFDALGLQEGGKARRTDTLARKLSAGIDYGTGLSAMLFNQSERFNRQVTMVAAYNMALERISTDNPKMPMAERQNLAAEEALYDTQEYNGGSTLETAPRVAQENIGRVAAMYKTYGLRMYYTMFKTAREALSLQTDPEVRKIAAKQLAGIHLTALFFAGVHGIPLYGAVQMFCDFVLFDDDEDDSNEIVRAALGEGWYKGPFNQILDELGIGADVASRVRLTGLLLQENRYNPDPSAEEFIGYYIGGPALSVAKRTGRGIVDIYNGEMQRGVENLLPVGFSNAYKSLGRYQQDGGIYSRRADAIYDDMTGGELFTQFLGFAPAEYIRIQEENQRVKRIDRSLAKQRSDLTKKYYIAARQGDWAEIGRLESEIQKFNSEHPSFEVTSDSIARSLKQHMKSSENMYNGVSLSPAMRRAAEDHLYGVRNGFMPPVR